MENEDLELKVTTITEKVIRDSLDPLLDWARGIVKKTLLMAEVENKLRALYPPGVVFTSKSPGVQELYAKYEGSTVVTDVLIALVDSCNVYYDYDEHGGYEVDRFTFEFKPEKV